MARAIPRRSMSRVAFRSTRLPSSAEVYLLEFLSAHLTETPGLSSPCLPSLAALKVLVHTRSTFRQRTWPATRPRHNFPSPLAGDLGLRRPACQTVRPEFPIAP